MASALLKQHQGEEEAAKERARTPGSGFRVNELMRPRPGREGPKAPTSTSSPKKGGGRGGRRSPTGSFSPPREAGKPLPPFSTAYKTRHDLSGEPIETAAPKLSKHAVGSYAPRRSRLDAIARPLPRAEPWIESLASSLGETGTTLSEAERKMVMADNEIYIKGLMRRSQRSANYQLQAKAEAD